MNGIAITSAVANLLLLGVFAYLTFKMTAKKLNAYYLHLLYGVNSGIVDI